MLTKPRIKNNIFNILFLLIIISGMINGVVGELIYLFSLTAMVALLTPFLFYHKKIAHFMAFVIIIVVSAALIIIGTNNLFADSGFWLFRGTLKSLIIPLFFFLMFNLGFFDKKTYDCFLLVMVLINIISIIVILVTKTIISIMPGSSENFLSAIDCLLLVSVLFGKNNNKKLSIISFVVFVTYTIISMSRLSIVLLVVILILYVFRRINPVFKICAFLLLILSVSVFMLFFSGIVYQLFEPRIKLINECLEFYNSGTINQQIFGYGTVYFPAGLARNPAPAHIFIFEILLCFGVVGLVFVGILLISLFVFLLRKQQSQFYLILTVVIYLAIGLVNPFITTSFFLSLAALVSLFYFLKAPSKQITQYKMARSF